jgi:hypothetical protein
MLARGTVCNSSQRRFVTRVTLREICRQHGLRVVAVLAAAFHISQRRRGINAAVRVGRLASLPQTRRLPSRL